MVLTINYSDLQNIKKQMIDKKITDDKQIYMSIENCKSTLNYMYKNKLVQNKSKMDYEYELYNFAQDMLKNTDKSYKELERMYNINSNFIVRPGELRLLI